jgi:hypothetical protein
MPSFGVVLLPERTRAKCTRHAKERRDSPKHLTTVRRRILHWFGTTFFILIATVFAGCGGATGKSSNTLPAGVEAGTDAHAAVTGIYPASSGETCCWLNREAHFYVAVTNDVSTLRLKIYVPAIGPLAKNPGTITLLENKKSGTDSKILHTGTQDVDFPIARESIAGGLISVDIKMAQSFVPSDLGLNGDVRRVSAVLLNASAF